MLLQKLLTNKIFCSQGIVRKTYKKNILNLLQRPGVQTTWNIYKMKNVFNYPISSNKRPRRLLDFETVKCGAYFRGRRLFQS